MATLRTWLADDDGLGVQLGEGVGGVVPIPMNVRLAREGASQVIHAGILVENADPIKSPDDLEWWAARVRKR